MTMESVWRCFRTVSSGGLWWYCQF